MTTLIKMTVFIFGSCPTKTQLDRYNDIRPSDFVKMFLVPFCCSIVIREDNTSKKASVNPFILLSTPSLCPWKFKEPARGVGQMMSQVISQ